MKQNKLYNTAIYCRLSLDDGNEGDSSSIKIQKMMLEKYARKILDLTTVAEEKVKKTTKGELGKFL